MSAGAIASGLQHRITRLAVAAALAVVAVIAAGHLADRGVSTDERLEPALRPGFGPRTYSEALAAAERGVDGARARLERDSGDWLYMEGLAGALMARHRLAARPDDLAEADRLLDWALASVPWPAGPALSRAAVSLAVHDLGAADAALARFDASAVPPSEAEQLDARSIRCEIAFQRGRLAEAERLCGGSDDPGLRQRLANIAAKRGDTDKAARAIEALMRRPGLPPLTLAQLALQRASVALAEGDWEASGRWARAAERVFPGYWLSEAFVAQQYALEGNNPESRRRFAALVGRTRNPEMMGALAALAEADGEEGEAREWIVEGAGVWVGRVNFLPLAYSTHHAEFVLAHGSPTVALHLARNDYARRPFSTPAVNYARALLANGRAAEALAVLRATGSRDFRTAAMKLEEHHALMALRRPDQARIARQQAYALNPKIEDPRQRFVFFDQD